MKEYESVEKILHDFSQLEKNNIFPFLREEFGTINTAYLLYQAIDQGVDIYAYLVNGKSIIEFDVSNTDNSISKNEIITVEEYAKTIQGKGKAKLVARNNLNALLKKSYYPIDE